MLAPVFCPSMDHRLPLAAFATLVVLALVTMSWAGRSEINQAQFDGCLRGTAKTVKDARKSASDAVRERSLSKTDEDESSDAHLMSSDVSEDVARTILQGAGISPPKTVEKISYMSPYSPAVRAQRKSFCARAYPRPSWLGL